jgi:hypothetical protein
MVCSCKHPNRYTSTECIDTDTEVVLLWRARQQAHAYNSNLYAGVTIKGSSMQWTHYSSAVNGIRAVSRLSTLKSMLQTGVEVDMITKRTASDTNTCVIAASAAPPHKLEHCCSSLAEGEDVDTMALSGSGSCQIPSTIRATLKRSLPPITYSTQGCRCLSPL